MAHKSIARTRKKLYFSASSAICALLAATTVSSQSANTLTIADIFVPASNWALSSEDSYALVRAGCLETLTTTNFEMELVPSLAESWRQVEPKVWEFVIRPGVKFQNGEDLTGQTAAAALINLLNSEIPARSFKPDLVASVEATEDMVVRITTVNEDVLFPYAVGTPFTGILAPAAYDEDGGVNILGTCTGPYEIVDASSQGLKMTRNESYWGDKPDIEHVELLFIPDATARATMIRSGEVDIAKELPLTALGQLESSENIQTLTTPVLRTTALIFNNKRDTLADARVREALSLAIDPGVISAAIFEDEFPPAVGPFSPSTPWAPADATPRSADLERARALLNEAGVDPASLSLEVIAYNERPQFKDIAAVMQQQLKELGVNLTIRTGDWAAVEVDLMSGNYDMTLMSRGYVFEYADPIGYFNFDFVCGGSFNLAHYCSSELDALVKKAATTADPDERASIYQELAKWIKSQTIHHFLVHESTIDAHGNSLTGYRVDPLQLRYLNPQMRLQ